METSGAAGIASAALVIGLLLWLVAGWPWWLVLLVVPLAALTASAEDQN